MVEIRDFVAAGENRASKATKKNSWGVWGHCKPPPPNGVRGKASEKFLI